MHLRHQTSPSDTDCDDEVEEIVAAPSLSDMRQ